VESAGKCSVEPVIAPGQVDLTPPVLTVSARVSGVPLGWAEPIAKGVLEDGSRVTI